MFPRMLNLAFATAIAALKSSPGNESVAFCTFGSDSYAPQVRRILKEAEESGWFSSWKGHNHHTLPAAFRARHADILHETGRGSGYWIWKYPVMQEALDSIEPGGFVVYLDAGCQLNTKGSRRFWQYLDMLRKSKYDVLNFSGFLKDVYQAYKWTTKAVFDHLHVAANDTRIRNGLMLIGGIQVLQKGPHSALYLRRISEVLEADAWLFSDRCCQRAHDARSTRWLAQLLLLSNRPAVQCRSIQG